MQGNNKKIKVLYIQGVTRFGGAIISLLETINTLKTDIEALIATSKEGVFTKICREKEIPYKVIPMGMWRKVKSWYNMPYVFFKLLKTIKEEKIDIIHANTLWDAPYALIAGKFCRKKTIVSIRGTFDERMFKKYMANILDLMIFVSIESRMKSRIINNKTKIIYNVTNIENTTDKKRLNKFTLSIIGRIDSYKGQLEFCETVLKSLNHKIRNYELVIAGEATKKDKWIEERLKELSKNYPIKLLGVVTEINKVYKNSNVILFTTKLEQHEGLPRVYIEAYANKTPVISTKVTSTDELIEHGKTGIVCRLDNMEQHIINLLLNRRLLKILSENGYKHVMNIINKEKFKNKTVKAYMEVLNV